MFLFSSRYRTKHRRYRIWKWLWLELSTYEFWRILIPAYYHLENIFVYNILLRLSCSGLPCSNLSWLCCCSCTGCSVYLEMSRSSHCKPCKFPSCLSCCSMPKCSFFSCPSLSCCRNISCRRLCCFISLPSLSCPPCCSCCECKCNCKCSCKCSFPKCSQVSSCRLCTKSCCNPCSLCCCF